MRNFHSALSWKWKKKRKEKFLVEREDTKDEDKRCFCSIALYPSLGAFWGVKVRFVAKTNLLQPFTGLFSGFLVQFTLFAADRPVIDDAFLTPGGLSVGLLGLDYDF